METVLHDRWGAIGREEWTALLAESPTNTVFQTFEWHAAWFQAYSVESEGFLVASREKGRLVGLAPLVPRRRCGKLGCPDSNRTQMIAYKNERI